MGMEHGYMKWMRGTVGKPKDSPGCMAMISLVSSSMISIDCCLIIHSKNMRYIDQRFLQYPIPNDWNIFVLASKT